MTEEKAGGLCAQEAAAILSPEEIRDYLAARHPLCRKKHKIREKAANIGSQL